MLSAVQRLAFAGLLTVCACGDPASPETAERQAVASVTVTPPTTSVVQGATLQLTAVLRDAKGTVLSDRSISWSAGDPTVASVSQTGLVTGVRAGNSTIVTATSEGRTGSTTVVVVVAAVRLRAGTAVLTALQDTLRVEALGVDANGIEVSLASAEWASSDPLTLSVTSSGLVTALRVGTATISARAGEVSASIQISVQQQVASLTIGGGPNPALVKAIGVTLRFTAAATDRNGNPVPSVTPTWSIANPNVATVDQFGVVTTRSVGKTEVTASVGQVTGRFSFEVATRIRVPIDPYLATPIANAQWEIPVVLVSYLPTVDGITLDVTKCPDFYILNPRSLADIERDLLDIYRRKKMAREQGSRFRAYSDAQARPSLGFRVIEHIIAYEVPPATTRQYLPPGNYLIDWPRVFSDLGVDALIRDRGAREIWFAYSSFDSGFPSYNAATHNLSDSRFLWESNMSSPTTGDVSNSDRNPTDLPVYGHTYIVYGINFRRSQAEAIHNIGHQLEAMFSYVNQRYDGNTNLFWKKFVGQNAAGEFITGRAGWTHMPPNTTQHYDYLNPTPVQSDIEDWRPDGAGAKKSVSVATWAGHTYPWPGAADFGQRVEAQWYIYWMQSMPGLNNTIPLGSGQLTNWWGFVADWDAAIRGLVGLATVRDG